MIIQSQGQWVYLKLSILQVYLFSVARFIDTQIIQVIIYFLIDNWKGLNRYWYFILFSDLHFLFYFY